MKKKPPVCAAVVVSRFVHKQSRSFTHLKHSSIPAQGPSRFRRAGLQHDKNEVAGMLVCGCARVWVCLSVGVGV